MKQCGTKGHLSLTTRTRSSLLTRYAAAVATRKEYEAIYYKELAKCGDQDALYSLPREEIDEDIVLTT